VELQIHAFSTSVLDGGEWSASRAGHFTPAVRVPGTHWIGGWVSRRAGLDAVAMRKKKSHHCPTTGNGTPVGSSRPVIPRQSSDSNTRLSAGMTSMWPSHLAINTTLCSGAYVITGL